MGVISTGNFFSNEEPRERGGTDFEFREKTKLTLGFDPTDGPEEEVGSTPCASAKTYPPFTI